MSVTYQRFALGEILKRVERFENRDDFTEYQFAGTYSFARGIFIGERKFGSTFKLPKIQRIHAGDFVYCKIMAWEGAFGVAPKEAHNCVLSGAFVAYEVDQKKVDLNYLDYYFKLPFVWKSIGKQSTGTNVRRQSLHPRQFESAKISLPSLPEQRRIVARIEELATKIEEAQNIRQLAIKETEILSSIASNSLLSNPKWPYYAVEELVGRANLKNGKSIKPTDQPSTIRCLTLSSMRNGLINCSESKRIGMTIQEAKPYLVQKGDVFIVRGNGSKDLVGRAGIVADKCKGIIFPDLFIRIPLNPDTILGEFFVSVWNSKWMRNIIIEEAKTTSGIWKINQGHIASFSIPVPPLDEQRKVITYLDNLSSKIAPLKVLQTETAAELDALMPSILDKAFRGEL